MATGPYRPALQIGSHQEPTRAQQCRGTAFTLWTGNTLPLMRTEKRVLLQSWFFELVGLCKPLESLYPLLDSTFKNRTLQQNQKAHVFLLTYSPQETVCRARGL